MASITLVRGTLKGFDQLLNLVLDDAHETLRGTELSDFVTSTLVYCFDILPTDSADILIARNR